MDEEQLRTQIAQRLGVSALPEAEQMSLIDDVNEALLSRIFLRTMERLSDEDQETLADLMEDEQTTPEAMDGFLRGAVEDYDGFLKEVVDAFMTEMDAAGTEAVGQ